MKGSLLALSLVCALALSACATGTEAGAGSTATHGSHDETHQHVSDGGPAPAGIIAATDPAFPVGSEVIVHADHMPGMAGETATVVGAFDTTTYSVSYTPTDGGSPVHDHRWVVHEELVDAGAAPLPVGTEVTLGAGHMPGMSGAAATIDSATGETVYMVDITGGDTPMRNHKWVTESELSAAP